MIFTVWTRLRGESKGKFMANMAKRVLYLDLDGTVRKGFDDLGRFVNGPEDVEIFDGVPELLAEYKRAGWRIVACTNQGGVALGHVKVEDVMLALKRTDELCGSAFDTIATCLHHPQAKQLENRHCFCRKPRYGMVMMASYQLSLRYPGEMYPADLALFVGDRPEDRECAGGAGIRFVDAKEWRADGRRFLWFLTTNDA